MVRTGVTGLTTLPFEQPLGAVPVGDGMVRFRVFSLEHEPVLVVGGVEHAMVDEGHGTWVATVAAAAGDDYAYIIDGAAAARPAHAAAARRAARAVAGRRPGARGRGPTTAGTAWRWSDLVVYELHVGTFTAEGTFDAVIPHLGELRRAGRHGDRADAGRRLPGPPWLGL